MSERACMYCKPVQRIAFWGALPEARWKRPVLLLLSVLLGGGIAWLTWRLHGDPKYTYFPLLSVPLAILTFLGLLVSINGCNACVARLMGDV